MTLDPLQLDTLLAHGEKLFQQAIKIWIAGGWGMVAIAVDAIVMCAMGLHIYFRLAGKKFLRVRERTWRRWIDHPQERRGPIGEHLNLVTSATTLEESANLFSGLRTTEIAPFERDLRVMKICVNTAPLLGLFGTVTGMLATFGALATGSGGDKTMAMVAKGISEALITTETGLVVAIPGLFFHYQLVRKHDRYKAFLAHLETVCTQILYAKLKERKAA
jgi:biopolymer transport protein ExbB